MIMSEIRCTCGALLSSVEAICESCLPSREHEAPRRTESLLRVRGVGRIATEPRSLLVLLDERPTDDDIRSLHEFLRGWYP